MHPALAVARALRHAQPGLEVAFLGGARGHERRLLAGGEFAYHQLVVRSLRSADLGLNTLLDPIRLLLSVPQAWWLLGRLRPAVVFSSGGYLAIPLLLAARARGIPSLVWEGNVIPGRATRAVARFASRVAVSFPPTAESFPGKAFVSGTPIRTFAGIDRARARRRFGAGDADRLLLVFGGSQAVARIDAAIDGSLERLLADWRVVHLTGDRGLAAAQARRARLGDAWRDRYQVLAQLDDGMADALVAADLVLGRAGSSTCAEVTAVGVASILVPYPFAGAHQHANAAWLANAGACVVVRDADLDSDRLLGEASTLRHDGRREALAAAARGLGRPDAAGVIAREMLTLAGQPS